MNSGPGHRQWLFFFTQWKHECRHCLRECSIVRAIAEPSDAAQLINPAAFQKLADYLRSQYTVLDTDEESGVVLDMHIQWLERCADPFALNLKLYTRIEDVLLLGP